jgi:hypothetical protein
MSEKAPVVASLITKAVESKSSITYTSDDLWAAIGAKAEQTRFDQRTLALTDPSAYNTNRNKALEQLKASTITAFSSTYQTYIDAGVSSPQAKKLAEEAAKSTYAIGMKALRQVFPSATDSVFQGASTAPSVMMARSMASTRKKAPANRKKPAQKRR